MKELQLQELEVKSNEVFVNTRQIAKEIGKNHFHVLRDLEKILRELKPNLDLVNIEKWIKKSSYKDDSGKTNKQYLLSKDGFTLLVFNYQGYNEFKIKYIQKFNKMEEYIRIKLSEEWKTSRRNGVLTRRKETDTIAQKLIPLAISQGSTNYKMFYANYSKLVNKSVGINAGEREEINDDVLRYIETLENIIEKTIEDEVDNNTNYKDIYKICKDKCELFTKISRVPKVKYIDYND